MLDDGAASKELVAPVPQGDEAPGQPVSDAAGDEGVLADAGEADEGMLIYFTHPLVFLRHPPRQLPAWRLPPTCNGDVFLTT